MKISKVNAVYFSPTFSSGEITGLVAGEMALAGSLGQGENIDLSKTEEDEAAHEFGPEDVVCVGVPSYGGRVPGIAAKRMENLRGDGTAAVVIAVYGNRDYDDTLLEMKDILTERGFTVIAGLAAIAQHSIAPSIAAGRPDEKDRHELREAARAIWEKLEDLAAPADGQVEVKGKRPYKEYGGSAMKPTADENCVGCGTCAEQCPVKAIPAEAPNTTDRERCISCMRCIKVCPAGARKLDPAGIAAVEQRLSKICGERKENELYI